MPWLPANIANLPKNIPPFNKSLYNPWDGFNSKADKINDAIRAKKLEIKQRKSNKIKYKKLSHWEYEVTATDKLLGKIEQNSSGKWMIKPSFKYEEEDFYARISLSEKHNNFREAGNALVEFWLNC